MSDSPKSQRALDWVNFFITDVKDGVGIYLSIYLLAIHHWDPGKIGLIMSLPGFIGIAVQSPVGAWIDNTRHKRFLILGASILIALGCIAIVLFPKYFVIMGSQIITGLVQAVYSPAIAAITLGMVGHIQLSKRIGRNESFNHLGNMCAAVLAGLIGKFYSYEGIFYLSVLQCIAISFAILMIKEKDIDHSLARAADKYERKNFQVKDIRTLFTNKNVFFFILAMGMFHLSNGALLPLLGQKLSMDDEKNAPVYLSACIIIAQAVMIFVAWYAGKKAEQGRKKIFLISFMILPIRGLLYSFIDDAYVLTALQLFDGISAGIFGVVSILMMADLSKGSGHFNLLQGTVYSMMGMGIAISNLLSGYIINYFGYDTGFLFLAVLGAFALILFWKYVPESKDLKTVTSLS